MRQLQEIVYAEFEDFRKQTETLTVRAVVPRSELKQLSRVIAKIERNREDGELTFGFDDIDDFIGIKVLCPYSSDADIVIEWMLAHSGFDVNPRDPKTARRDREAGYRGFHFTVRLANGLARGREDLLDLRCEVQVKTMLEEAWDAKTHDIQYRREREINPTLIAQMKLLSDALQVVDRQSELLKQQIIQQIIETEFEEARRKAAVVQVYLRENQDVFQRLVEERQVSGDILSGRISERDASTLAQYVSQNRGPDRISASLCRTAALLALQARGQRFAVLCMDVCDEFIRSQPSHPRGYLVKASVAWAFDHLDDAITETQTAVGLAEALNDEDLICESKSNLAYWLAEKVWMLRRRKQTIPAGLVESAFANIDHGLSREPTAAAFLDTKGFLIVVSAENRDALTQGHTLLLQAVSNAAGRPEEGIARAFHARHDRIALMRLLEFA